MDSLFAFSKTMKLFLFLVGIFTITMGALWHYRVPASYTVWSRLGLDTIATALNPRDPDLWFAIGNSYFGHGTTYDIQRAQRAFAAATALRQDFPEAHYQLGRTYFIEGRFDAALAEMNATLHYAPDFKKAYYMYGLINGYAGDLDEAVYGFSEFIKRDDFNWAGYNDLVWIYFKKGDYQKTREVAEAGLRHAERNPWLNTIYGTALLNLGEKEKAKAVLEIALEESEKMSEKDWGKAYPGNNPAIYKQGLEEMKSSIRHNLDLLIRKDIL